MPLSIDLINTNHRKNDSLVILVKNIKVVDCLTVIRINCTLLQFGIQLS